MRTAREVLDRKMGGVDCDDDESALIKREIRCGGRLSSEAARLFPVEADEVGDEVVPTD